MELNPAVRSVTEWKEDYSFSEILLSLRASSHSISSLGQQHRRRSQYDDPIDAEAGPSPPQNIFHDQEPFAAKHDE